MLHERTDETMEYFDADRECALYGDAEEMISKIDYYLANPREREAIAEAGRRRCLTSGYSIDDRAATILAKHGELRAARAI